MFLARQNLFKDKTRLALSIGGGALAVMLVLLLNGFLAGLDRPITPHPPPRPRPGAAGRAPEADDEVVFDRVLAARHGIQLGDAFEIMGQAFTAVGLSDGTTSWM